jgi:hypothetical protein
MSKDAENMQAKVKRHNNLLRGKGGGGLEFPPNLNLGAICMFSKFKIKIQDKLYPTEVAVYSKYMRRTVLPKNDNYVPT